MEPKISKGYISRYIAKKFENGEDPEVFGFYSSGTPKGPSVPAILLVSTNGEEPRVFTEERVKAFYNDLMNAAMDGPYLPNSEGMEGVARDFGITL